MMSDQGNGQVARIECVGETVANYAKVHSDGNDQKKRHHRFAKD